MALASKPISSAAERYAQRIVWRLSLAAADDSSAAASRRFAAASGGITISFKPAILSLEVTPQITPDDKIIMDHIGFAYDLSGYDRDDPESPIVRRACAFYANLAKLSPIHQQRLKVYEVAQRRRVGAATGR